MLVQVLGIFPLSPVTKNRYKAFEQCFSPLAQLSQKKYFYVSRDPLSFFNA
jgi:hypothetical protein